MSVRKGRVRKAGPAGTVLRWGSATGPKLVRTKGARWSREAERRFLEVLAGSCNVRLAAAEAGFSPSSIYKRRQNDAAFATSWRQALEQGYARIEMALVRATADALDGDPPNAELPIERMTVQDALAVLRFHRDTVAGTRSPGRGHDWRAREPSLEDVRASILRKLEVIEAKRLRAGGAALPLMLTDGRADGAR